MSKLERYAIAGIILLMVAAVVVIFAGRWLERPAEPQPPSTAQDVVTETETMKARVLQVLEEGVDELSGYPYQRVLLRVRDGSMAGQVLEVEEGTVNVITNDRLFDVGDMVLLVREESCMQGQCYEHIYISDFVRTTPLLWIAALFVGLVVLIGRERGLRSLLGTALSLIVIFVFILPLIRAGLDPVLVSVIGSAGLLVVSTYLVYGWNYKAHAAVLGMVLSLCLTWGLAAAFVSWTHLTGLGSPEEASYLSLEIGTDLNFRGLVLGGIIIGSLGVLDDICVGQASSVFELANANRDLDWRRLFRSSLNIGRDHIAAMVNTLLLAYVGASLPLMLVFTIYQEPLGYRINREPITEEIVRTLVGSMGLILAVPLTGLIASLVARWAVLRDQAAAKERFDAESVA